jgi:hypothetical protein
MKSIYCWNKRMALKRKLSILAYMIVRLKDDRKTVRPKKFPEFIRPCGVWLDTTQSEFRYHHIAASMMRGKTIEEIERLPKDPNTKDSRIRPNMRMVNTIMEGCLDENVCAGIEQPNEVSASGAGRPCPG